MSITRTESSPFAPLAPHEVAPLEPVLASPLSTAVGSGFATACGLSCGSALSTATYADVRLKTIFECGKYDPQVGDVAVLCRYPLIVSQGEWARLAAWAELLAAETIAAETELAERPDVHRELGLPWSVRRALRRIGAQGIPASVARVMRFDFHATAAGWRISEVNSDVPGGFIEAAGFSQLMAAASGLECSGDPATAWVSALVNHTPANAAIGLVYATAYTDDWQVMAYLAERLTAAGRRPMLIGPDSLRWTQGHASALTQGGRFEPLAALLRFFPGEWLGNVARKSGWQHWFAGGKTPMANPATALLTQSKRLPLVWDRLSTPMPTWQSLLPETRDPREKRFKNLPAELENGAQEWILKPALGRVGADIGMAGLTTAKLWKQIRRNLWFWPRGWVVQARFEATPVFGPDGPVYPCLGVYTVDGRAAGVYGRLARRALIDDQAQDVAVLLPTAGQESATLPRTTEPGTRHSV